MRKIKDPKTFRKVMGQLRSSQQRIGFVPTMGALHAGHMSLVRASKKENDVTVVSIFVNPSQFSPGEDFDQYPRTLKDDVALLTAAGVDYLFIPKASVFRPQDEATRIEIGKNFGKVLPGSKPITDVLCGAFRPGHFIGVATVVAKLFNVVVPHRAYFGAKDYQQSVIIRKMVRDLFFDIQIRVMPTVRMPQGIAMSSRNLYLSSAEIEKAAGLSRCLFWIRDELKGHRLSIDKIRSLALEQLKKTTTGIDYLEIVDPRNLNPLKNRQKEMLAIGACYVGKTRLIDNVIIKLKKKKA